MSDIDDATAKYMFSRYVDLGLKPPQHLLEAINGILKSNFPKKEAAEKKVLNHQIYWKCVFTLIGMHQIKNNCTKQEAIKVLANLIHKSDRTISNNASKDSSKNAYQLGIDIALVSIDEKHLENIKNDTVKDFLTDDYLYYQEQFYTAKYFDIVSMLSKA